METWVKVYRKLLEWEWHTEPNMVSLFLHLIVLANYEDKRWHGIVIKRGQLATSLISLSDITGISVQSVRTCLKRLEETGEILQKSTNKFRVITICKYDIYQDVTNADQQTTNKQLTNNQQTTNKQLTTTKEYKEDKNNKKKILSKDNIKEKVCIAPEFEVVFNTWLEYKHERRESYKSPKSVQACYNKLLKLANGNPLIAGLIVEQSMANNWAGLFPLKSDNNGLDNKQAKLIADGANAIAALEAEGGSITECPF